jgi:RIO kinase 2
VDPVRLAGELTSKLSDEEFKLLSAATTQIRRFESIPIEALALRSGLPRERCLHAVEALRKKRLLRFSPGGYALTMLSLDTLALHLFARERMIQRIGPSIGVGKESDVYEALTPTGSPCALKFFRLGRTSFRELLRKRSYGVSQGHKWLSMSIQSARREASLLGYLEGFNLPVPKCLGRHLHTILMEMKLGLPLYKVKSLDDAGQILLNVLSAIREIYLKAGLINSDLSEYNILITPQHEVTLIDWPQAVKVGEGGSEPAIRRDLLNIISHFKRKFGVGADVSEALRYCKGEIEGVRVG